MTDIPKLEHKPDATFDAPKLEIPAEYRELAEAAAAVVPWLDEFCQEKHPLAEQYRDARYRCEKSRQHAERYFMLKDQRDGAIERFRKALESLQVIAEE